MPSITCPSCGADLETPEAPESGIVEYFASHLGVALFFIGILDILYSGGILAGTPHRPSANPGSWFICSFLCFLIASVEHLRRDLRTAFIGKPPRTATPDPSHSVPPGGKPPCQP